MGARSHQRTDATRRRRVCLAEEVGGEDEEDHEDGEDEEGDLQPLVDFATEGDGIETLALETGGVVLVVVVMMFFHYFNIL